MWTEKVLCRLKEYGVIFIDTSNGYMKTFIIYYALGLKIFHGFDLRPTCNFWDSYETFVCATFVVAVSYSRMLKSYVKTLSHIISILAYWPKYTVHYDIKEHPHKLKISKVALFVCMWQRCMKEIPLTSRRVSMCAIIIFIIIITFPFY